MINAPLKKVLFVSAFIMAGMFVAQGLKARGTLKAKVAAQDAVTESLVRWREMFSALSDSRVKWDKSYVKEESIQDLVNLIEHVGFERYGIETDNDNLVLTKVEQVSQNDSPIGLTQICMGTGTGDGGTLWVRAPNYQGLLMGIDKLARRPDIYIGNISLQGDRAFPLAKLGDFCVLLRNS